MQRKLESIIKEIIPPIVLRGAQAVYLSLSEKCVPQEKGAEKGPEWYDASFENSDRWRRHYSETNYYFLWSVIVDRMIRAGVESILEVGCGTGQLACLIRDKGISRYHGFDFSRKRIEQAKRVCPEFVFSRQDAFQTDLFTTFDYDAVICTEFLEHVEGDIEVLNRIRSGARFYGSVPNFPFPSHVRHFKSEKEVLSRYGQCFTDIHIDAFLAEAKSKTYYLIEGIKI